jgi:hypothetical protein
MATAAATTTIATAAMLRRRSQRRLIQCRRDPRRLRRRPLLWETSGLSDLSGTSELTF